MASPGSFFSRLSLSPAKTFCKIFSFWRRRLNADYTTRRHLLIHPTMGRGQSPLCT
jgi:hypothetical protein